MKQGKTVAGWNAALEWAAGMIEGGYPDDAPATPSALAMTIRAKRDDVDLLLTGLESAKQVFHQARAKRTALASGQSATSCGIPSTPARTVPEDREEEAETMLSGSGLMRLAEISAYNLYLATLVGDPAPRVKKIGDRMRAPVPGDLVLEISTIYREGGRYESRVGERLGRLLRVVREDVYTAEVWYGRECGAQPGEPIPTERVWYIELADGREYRWHNASFIAVPEGIDSFENTEEGHNGR